MEGRIKQQRQENNISKNNILQSWRQEGIAVTIHFFLSSSFFVSFLCLSLSLSLSLSLCVSLFSCISCCCCSSFLSVCQVNVKAEFDGLKLQPPSSGSTPLIEESPLQA